MSTRTSVHRRLDGFSFFPVAIEPDKWSPNERKKYDLLDAGRRRTVEVYPKSWATIMLTFRQCVYVELEVQPVGSILLGLGQQMYISILSPNFTLRDEYNIPDNLPLCGIVRDMPKPAPY